MQPNHDEPHAISEYVIYHLCHGNYEQALSLINEYICISRNHRAIMEQLELKNIILRLRIQTDPSMLIGPTTMSNALPHSFTYEMLDVVQKVIRCNNHYEVLRVSHDATFSEVKRAYKRLALRLHPDKNHVPMADDAFRKISAAADMLTDAKKRIEYDVDLMLNGVRRNTAYGFSSNGSGSSPFRAAGGAERTWQDSSDAEQQTYFEETQEQQQMNWRRRKPYEPANQRVPQRETNYRADQILFGLLLTGFLMFSISYFMKTAQPYSFEETSLFTVRRVTHNFGVPYYVTPSFIETKLVKNIEKFEKEIENAYIYSLRQRCLVEHATPEIDELIEKLKSTSVSPDNTTSLLSEISATKDPKLFDKHELADCFLTLAKSEDTNVRKEAAKCIAEITKSEVQRKKFTKRDIIKSFLECLHNVPCTSTSDNGGGSLELPIQICRALGNICYLNDDARDLILDLKGDEVLIRLLDVTEFGDAANALQFIKVRGGLLSNYLLGGEGLAKRAMELQIMEKLHNIIRIGVTNVEQHEDLLLNTLPLLSILTENVADLNFNANLNIQLSRILAASTNPDLAEMCLELLHYQAENDDVKLLLAKDGLCETIYNLLEKYKTLASTSEARALMKLACELIVLILTGDESMHYLYTTPLLKNMEDWLDSTDIDLLTTGVLALGNFARTDSHCIYFVEHKVMNKLLDVLAKNNGVKDDVRLQHALLSALRNLVIPKPNKNAVIQAGLVETILPMLEIHQPPVVFKLLGTLRMTVDGQEKLALDLLKNKTLIEQLVHWSKSSDYVGVTGESLRLMAWLIKHAYLNKIAYALPRKGDAPAEQLADKLPITQDYDRSSLSEFVTIDGTVEAMVNMLTSQHLVMQNEALIALCILSVVYLSNRNASNVEAERLQDDLIKYDVGKKLAELISKSSDTMTKEIVENLQNCVNLLKMTDKLVTHLEQHNINELLKSIPILTEYCTL